MRDMGQYLNLEPDGSMILDRSLSEPLYGPAGGKERGWFANNPENPHVPGAAAVGSGIALASHKAFAAALEKGVPKEHRLFVTMYSAKEYRDMGAKTYLSGSGKTGFAIKPDGEIISVFSTEHKGEAAMLRAILLGGTKVEAFDGFLTREFYPRFGFKATGSMAWDEQYAPKGWDSSKDDHPSVVAMSLEAR